MVTRGLPLRAAGPNTSGQTTFAMGRIDGGGFAFGVSASDDGSGNTLLLARNDEAGAFRYSSANAVGKRWTNCGAANAVTGRTLNTTGNCYENVFGPKVGGVACAAMAIAPSPETLGADGQLNLRQTLFYSSDKGLTFTPTALTSVSGAADTAYAGPHIVIDPNNAQIIYVIGLSGVIKVTYNGGANWHVVSALLGALYHANANGGQTSNGQIVNLTPSNPINGIGTIQFAAYDLQNELAVGSNGGYDYVLASTSSSVTINRIQPNDGSGGNGKPGVVNNDDLYFGLGLSVTIDGSSGTVTNPGIALGDPNCSGSASKIVYFGFGHTGMWWTWDGNPEHAAATPAGGPANLGGLTTGGRAGGGRIAVSFDGTLYATNGDNFGWTFVPSGAGTGTWTHLPTDTTGPIVAIVPHLTVAGKAAFMSNTGGVRMFTGYGATLFSHQFGQTFVPGDGGLDQPWISSETTGLSGASAAWDPITADRIWICLGIGISFMDIPTSGGSWSANTISQSSGLESMIISRLVKTPSPNGNMLFACQDRPLMTSTGPSSPPPAYFPAPGHEAGGGYTVTYSDSDPTCVWGSENTGVYRNTNNGVAANWVSVNAALGGWNDIASTTSSSAVFNPNAPALWLVGTTYGIGSTAVASDGKVYVSSTNGNVGNDPTTDGGIHWTNTNTFGAITYTANAGSTVQTCLFDGSILAGDGTGPFGAQNHLAQDGAGNYWYFRAATGKLYKSTDGGAHFTTISTQSFNVGSGSVLIPMKGTSPLKMLFVSGTSGGGGFDQPWPLMYSSDVNAGGAFTSISNTYDVIAGDYGAPKPGNSIPAVFITGQLTQFAVWGVYRCDDITQVTPTWVYLSDANRICCDVIENALGTGKLFADKDTYGTVYVCTQGSGYMWGHI